MSEKIDLIYDLEDLDGAVIEGPREQKRLVGIRGWLIFPMLWIGFTALSVLNTMVTSEDGDARLGGLLLFGLLCIPGTLAFTRSHHFPKAWIAAFGIIVVLAFIGTAGEGEQAVFEIVRSAFWYVVWSAYLLTSKRVRNTFTR